MVAYSYKPRFEEPIIAGTKLHTMRGPRRRHARPGDEIRIVIEDYWAGRSGTATFDGEIRAIHPRSAEVTVRYEDHWHTTRSGDSRRRVRRVPVGDVDLIARDQ
jgi:hypothetical protein